MYTLQYAKCHVYCTSPARYEALAIALIAAHGRGRAIQAWAIKVKYSIAKKNMQLQPAR